jgi:hypothetical protein
MNAMARNQTLMIIRIINLERAQQHAPRPPFKGQPQKLGQGWKPRSEQKVPNTLDHSNIVDETPRFFQCRDAHSLALMCSMVSTRGQTLKFSLSSTILALLVVCYLLEGKFWMFLGSFLVEFSAH